MSKESFDELGQLIETDLVFLFRKIEEEKKYGDLSDQFKLDTKYDNKIIYILEEFKALVKDLLYNIDYEIPFKESTPSKELQIRLDLIEDVFLNFLGEINRPSMYMGPHSWHMGDIKKHLFENLLHALFCKKIKEEINILEAIEKYLDEWKRSVENNEIEVKILIPMPQVTSKEDYIILKDKVSIIKDNGLFIIKNNGCWANRINPCLVIRQIIPFYFGKKVYESNEIKKQHSKDLKVNWEQFIRLVQEVVSTLYMGGIYFKYETFVEEWPWFIGQNFIDIEELRNDLSKGSPKKNIFITRELIEKISRLYPLVRNSGFFMEQEYTVVQHHYLQLFIRDFTPDVILDAFIIFEFLFVREKAKSTTFLLAFNAGMFLSESPKEFLIIFRFFKRYYGIRSALVHGGKWYEKLKKYLVKDYDFESPEFLLDDLKKYLGKALIKLIHLKNTNPNILEDIFELDKVENLEKKYQFLLTLGKEYKLNGNYSYGVKMFLKSLELSSELGDDSKKEKCTNLLKIIYDSRNNIIAYREEFKQVVEELEIISELDEKRKKSAKNSLNAIKEFI